ncbi:unnamed protein product [Blepharisma stoltei]|uniref:Uncharacterized protein n=1 Tax=Blepharisma stoltei TaxID=1481888 RepID=A0AAU9JZT1_9CILI|nr:unnamed protein product [Blepharisma stoltei]
MDQEREQFNMMIEDNRDTELKVFFLSKLVHRYANFKHKCPPRRKAFQLSLNIFHDTKTNDYVQFSPSSASILAEREDAESFIMEPSTATHSSGLTSIRSFTSIEEQWLGRNKTYTNEEYEIIRQNFLHLYFTHKPNHGSRIYKNNPEVHISNIIQHFLDCFITTHNLLNILLAPLKGKEWVDLKSFVQSLEAIQQTVFDKSSFFYKEPGSDFKKNMTMQKLLFFFKMVEIYHEGELGRAQLQTVMSMALKKKKKASEQSRLVAWTLEKAKILSGKRKEYVTFEEFYKILKN